ncbi:NERD domain-containing protein [Bacillus sp. CMF12]|uniref:nuclease-related domain-containing protein n=1 Tax=Bacillus sp. CMF12 TaxID=2884834 RepID=UPI00207AF163|nr:nuclease-related domain-containing protein [Bacillus sp. CMF12]USK49676.1 NERD domain-containing protein [Bacillus sp. CMF12]
MISKSLKVPELNLQLEALLRRIPEHHPAREKVISEYKKRSAGFKGEERLFYYLSFLEPKKYWIFHDLRLSNGSHFFQIDALLLTANFALILEVKNWTGTLIFSPHFQQVIRIQNDKEEGFPDPLSQARHQTNQFRNWLGLNGFPDIPLEFLVVISHPSTIIKAETDPLQISKRVLHSHHLLSKMNGIENKFPQEKTDSKEIRKLCRTLLKKHNPAQSEILEHFNVSAEEILTGVSCPKCTSLPMIFHWGKWHCPMCLFSSSLAHEAAVQDYFRLIKPSITNSQFRSFTHIPSPYAASRLLSRMNLSFKRNKRHRIYEKSPEQ